MAICVGSSQNHYNTLLRRGKELCDFCDRTFQNRFDSIIHNASHIIIPLIKLNWLQCNICLYYFPTQDELENHQETKHPNTASKIQNVNNIAKSKIKFENSNEYDNIFENHPNYNINNITRHVKIESDIYKKENDVDNIKVNNACDSLRVKKKAIKAEVGSDEIIDLTDNDFSRFSDENKESIKSRLRFEDDGLFNDTILSNLISECKGKTLNEQNKNLHSENDISNVKSRNGLNNGNTVQTLIAGLIRSKMMQNGNIQSSKAHSNSVTDDHENNLVIAGTPKVKRFRYDGLCDNLNDIDKNNLPGTSEHVYKSVHYSELVKPGIYSCRYCFETFPNRLLLIQHEPKHIHMRKPLLYLCTYCDKYIAGNYRNLHRHILNQHPGASVEKKHKTHKCTKCSLKFRRYINHVKNYHEYECRGCGKEFNESSADEFHQHSKTCSTHNVLSKIINVCELCYSFFKVKMNVKYILMGTTVNEPGVRYPCAVCGKKFFELKMIKRVIYGKLGGNIVNVMKFKKRPLTNEERLKKFQYRLKQINLLNKF